MNALIYFFIAFSWGTGFLFVKILSEGVPPVTSSFLRVFFALLFLLPCYKILGKKAILPKGSHKKVWLTGILMFALPFYFLFVGGKLISPGLAGIVQGMITVWTLIFGVIFLPQEEPLSKGKVLGVSLGLLGLGFIFAPKIEIQGELNEILGITAILAATMGYGGAAILNRSIFSKFPGVTLHASLIHQLAAAAGALLLASLLLDPFGSFIQAYSNFKFLGSALFLGIASTGLAYLGLYHLIKEWGSVKAISTTYLVPFIAIASEFLYEKTIPNSHELVGAAFILSAIFLIHKKKEA